MKKLFTITFIVISSACLAQGNKLRALFIGNSYTYVNNLPQMLADVASSVGDTLLFDSNAIGGYTLQQHSTNATSLSKIAIGNWNYVVLQEQSQLPSFPDNQVAAEVYPAAHKLDSIITAANPCTETTFYMTWGRKNGDASNCAFFPPLCTYQGMDSLLNLRYQIMATANNAIVSPVGAVWHYIRNNFPAIELYQSDESHPTVAGTYAAACCFYAAMFRHNPTTITFNSSLSATDAANIRLAAKLIVYDNLINWHIGQYDPVANYSYTPSAPNQLSFTNTSLNASSYSWHFGTNDTSTAINPTHLFPSSGTYTVSLIASNCAKNDTLTQVLNVLATGILNSTNQNNALTIYPNPTSHMLTVQLSSASFCTYSILNYTGSQIANGTFTNRINQVDVSLFAQGIYILQVLQNNKIYTQQKFIITR